jgi:hypothetical protein
MSGGFDRRHRSVTGLGWAARLRARRLFPPFTRETAVQQVRAAEDGWNGCDPARMPPA